MRAWLDGCLDGLDPRADLERVREVVAAADGVDLGPLFVALAALDPVACAELSVGARAVPGATAARGALCAAEALEGVIAPSGLYARLRDLAPDAAREILATAVARHPTADWVLRLARRCEERPGETLLRAQRGGPHAVAALRLCARGGAVAALRAEALETGDPAVAAALWREGRPEDALDVAAATLAAHSQAAVLPWLAAAHGPDIEALADALAGRIADPAVAEWIVRQARSTTR